MKRPDNINGVTVPYDADLSVLKALVYSNSPKKWAAFVAIGFSKKTEALDILITLADSPDWSVRNATAEAMKYHVKVKRALPILRKLILDSSSHVIRASCRALSELKDSKSHDHIFALINSSDLSTRITGIQCISNVHKNTDFLPIFEIYKNDPDIEVRRETAWTLRKMASPENWEFLFEQWSKDIIDRHRVWACELTEAFGDLSNKQSLEELINDQNGHVRKAAKKALQKFINDS